MSFSIGSLNLYDILVWYAIGFLIYFVNELWICLNYKILTFSLTLNEPLVWYVLGFLTFSLFCECVMDMPFMVFLHFHWL
jgi:hypothetical protein